MSGPVLPGRAADSPENTTVAPGRFRVRPDPGLLAAGHRPDGALTPATTGLSQHLSFQQVTPSAAAVVSCHGDRIGPLAESVAAHAVVAQMDQARASNGTLEPQLGPHMPSPVPGPGAAEGIAQTGRGAPPHGVAARDRGVYSREPKAT